MLKGVKNKPTKYKFINFINLYNINGKHLR